MKTQFTDKKRRDKAAKQASNAILPKRDFEAMMTHDKTYYTAMDLELEYKMIKLDILSKKVKPIVESKDIKKITSNINDMCDFAEIQRDLYDIKGKLISQAKLVEDKQNHYDFVFLPQYKEELKESNKNFEDTLIKAKNISTMLMIAGEEYKEIIEKILFELEVYDCLDEKQKSNEEYLLNCYKPMKRLIGAYEKKVKEVEENKKYA
jgi:hypothetical protein|tara:strand:+ start:3372 stop:3992 length:621 start_codon:yes stop_codon:yes gene_type:complete